MIEIHQSLSIRIRNNINFKKRDLCLNSENTLEEY